MCSWHRTSAGGGSILAQTPCWTRAKKKWTDASGWCAGTTRSSFRKSSSRSWSRRFRLAGPDDELGFEESLGGARYRDIPWAFFWNKFEGQPGSRRTGGRLAGALARARRARGGGCAEPRAPDVGSGAKARELAETQGWGRKVPRPVGPQMLSTATRSSTSSTSTGATSAEARRECLRRQRRHRDRRRTVQNEEVEGPAVEARGGVRPALGAKYGFSPGEFGDEGPNPLELAYCLTVHKTQGSEFGRHLRRAHEPLPAALPASSCTPALDPAPEPAGHPARGPACPVSRLWRRRPLGDRAAHDQPLCGPAASVRWW